MLCLLSPAFSLYHFVSISLSLHISSNLSLPPSCLCASIPMDVNMQRCTWLSVLHSWVSKACSICACASPTHVQMTDPRELENHNAALSGVLLCFGYIQSNIYILFCLGCSHDLLTLAHIRHWFKQVVFLNCYPTSLPWQIHHNIINYLMSFCHFIKSEKLWTVLHV